MGSYAPSSAVRPPSSAEASTYPSRIAHAYAGWLERHPRADVLDVGPVCGETVNFLLPRVGSISVCDLFVRLQRDRTAGRFEKALPSYLDYKERCFDSIHLWDLPARLTDDGVRSLMERVRVLLKPEGTVIATSHGEGAEAAVYSFALRESLDITLRLQDHLKLPFYHRHNRDILAILAPLSLANSYVYRSGLREFQLRLPEGSRFDD